MSTEQPDDITAAPEPLPFEPDAPAPRLRLVFAAPSDKGRAIHALRTGTFTDSSGREATFTPDDLRTMAARLNETAQRRRPPINEGHDYGRAVGRMLEAVTRHGDNHLYITPRWNTMGQTLLAEEVYDAFSIELERDKGGYAIIGGALTNYPAVNGLHPVSLSAPAADVAVLTLPPADEPAEPDESQETPPMSETPQAASPAPEAPPAAPATPTPPALNLSDPAVRAQFEQYTAEMQAMYQQQYALAQEAARASARAEFERWRAEEGRRTALLAFAQHVTTATMDRPTSIAWSAEQVMEALTAPTAETVQRIFQDALDGALLVSGRPAGSSRGDAGEAGAWDALVLSYQQSGMAAHDAIKAAARKRPDLYAAQNGGR